MVLIILFPLLFSVSYFLHFIFILIIVPFFFFLTFSENKGEKKKVGESKIAGISAILANPPLLKTVSLCEIKGKKKTESSGFGI